MSHSIANVCSPSGAGNVLRAVSRFFRTAIHGDFRFRFDLPDGLLWKDIIIISRKIIHLCSRTYNATTTHPPADSRIHGGRARDRTVNVTLAGLPADEIASSPLSSMRGDDSDSDYYSSDDDEPLRNILICSKTSLAGSMAVTAATSNTFK